MFDQKNKYKSQIQSLQNDIKELKEGKQEPYHISIVTVKDENLQSEIEKTYFQEQKKCFLSLKGDEDAKYPSPGRARFNSSHYKSPSNQAAHRYAPLNFKSGEEKKEQAKSEFKFDHTPLRKEESKNF